jgi:hypothetical protein
VTLQLFDEPRAGDCELSFKVSVLKPLSNPSQSLASEFAVPTERGQLHAETLADCIAAPGPDRCP